MNEFNPARQNDADVPEVPAARKANDGRLRVLLLERKYIFGLTGPWLLGAAGLVVIMGLYLYGQMQPASPNINDLAGLQDSPAQPVNQQVAALPPPQRGVTTEIDGGDAQLRNDVVKMVEGVRNYSQTNRQAITQLSDALKTLSAQIAAQQQTINQDHEQIQSLNDQVSVLETQRFQASTQHSPVRRSPTAGMHISSIEDGMAWVAWQGKTWAVKEGDTLGPVSITQIDAPDRQVFTSAGVIR